MNALEYAIQMEKDGENYYREQAELNKNNGLYPVCLLLAEDENHHAQILNDKLHEKPYELKETNPLLRIRNVFQNLNNITIEGKSQVSQLDFYRVALEMERQSIDLYMKFLSQAADEGEREIFTYLIHQEKQHYEVLDEMVQLLQNAEQWVESAEFGIRKDY